MITSIFRILTIEPKLMFNLESYKIVDDVLNIVPVNGTISVGKVISLLKDKPILHKQYIPQVLKKLDSEGYISSLQIESETYTDIGYHLTYEGVLLIEYGGYSLMKKKEREDANRKSSHGWIITMGALLAGIYVVGQIIGFIYNFFNKSFCYIYNYF